MQFRCSVVIVSQLADQQPRTDASTFSGHSLRSGFLTSAAANGASTFKMMDRSRHKSADTLRGYVRAAKLFKDHAGAGLLWVRLFFMPAIDCITVMKSLACRRFVDTAINEKFARRRLPSDITRAIPCRARGAPRCKAKSKRTGKDRAPAVRRNGWGVGREPL
jgi:hypothetical protein